MASHIGRRKFLATLGGAAAGASLQSQPSPGTAQKTARIALVQEFVAAGE
jgi:hypothetical protein